MSGELRKNEEESEQRPVPEVSGESEVETPKNLILEKEGQSDIESQIKKIKKEAGLSSPEAKTTKEIIEESFPYNIEHVFIKAPGVQAEDITDLNESKEGRFRADQSKVEKYSGAKKITYLHTHPSETEDLGVIDKLFLLVRHGIGPKKYKNIDAISGLHSGEDIKGFLYLDNEKVPSAFVAVRNPKIGKVLGYNVLRKSKETPRFLLSGQSGNMFKRLFLGLMAKVGLDAISRDCKKYESARIKSIRSGDPFSAREAYDKLLKRYNLKSRLISAEGYRANEAETGFEEEK